MALIFVVFFSSSCTNPPAIGSLGQEDEPATVLHEVVNEEREQRSSKVPNGGIHCGFDLGCPSLIHTHTYIYIYYNHIYKYYIYIIIYIYTNNGGRRQIYL